MATYKITTTVTGDLYDAQVWLGDEQVAWESTNPWTGVTVVEITAHLLKVGYRMTAPSPDAAWKLTVAEGESAPNALHEESGSGDKARVIPVSLRGG